MTNINRNKIKWNNIIKICGNRNLKVDKNPMFNEIKCHFFKLCQMERKINNEDFRIHNWRKFDAVIHSETFDPNPE